MVRMGVPVAHRRRTSRSIRWARERDAVPADGNGRRGTVRDVTTRLMISGVRRVRRVGRRVGRGAVLRVMMGRHDCWTKRSIDKRAHDQLWVRFGDRKFLGWGRGRVEETQAVIEIEVREMADVDEASCALLGSHDDNDTPSRLRRCFLLSPLSKTGASNSLQGAPPRRAIRPSVVCCSM
jgi:hypothetical protein